MQLEECNDQPGCKNVFRSFKADFLRGVILRGISFVNSANFMLGTGIATSFTPSFSVVNSRRGIEEAGQ